MHVEVPWGRIIVRSSRKGRSLRNSEKLSKASLGLAAPQGTKFKVPGPRFKSSQMRMEPQVPVTGLVLWAGPCPPIHTLKPCPQRDCAGACREVVKVRRADKGEALKPQAGALGTRWADPSSQPRPRARTASQEAGATISDLQPLNGEKPLSVV